MSKDTRIAIVGLLTPLVLALCGWINAHSRLVEAERAEHEMSDSYQGYVEYVMRQRGCEP